MLIVKATKKKNAVREIKMPSQQRNEIENLHYIQNIKNKYKKLT